jgi:hypothetical protein
MPAAFDDIFKEKLLMRQKNCLEKSSLQAKKCGGQMVA